MANPHISLLVLLFLSLSPLSFSERCHPNDKKALLEIRKDINDPRYVGDPKTDCCDWGAVTCDQKTNRTIRFIINQPHLQRPFPAALGDLPYLQMLIFRYTKITGQIPQAISKLSNLEFFYMQGNLLSGPVPSFLAKLKKVTYIDLSFNNLTGSIPPSLSQLPELYGLILSGNKLTGSIPESFGNFKQPYIVLYLSRNQLSGPIPRSFGSGNLFDIDVSRNRLEGDLSYLFMNNKSFLTRAYFSRNLFEFDLSNIIEFPATLENLDLNHNRISGSIPKGLTKLTGLVTLNLSYNRLCGEIPVGGKLQEFNYTSYFHNKCLCGSPLPNC